MSIVMIESSRDSAKPGWVTKPTTGQEDEQLAPSLRIGFWGTHSLFSQVVLTTLLDHNALTLVALPADEAPAPPVALWAPPRLPPSAVDELVIVNNAVTAPLVQRAWQKQIPTYQVQRLRSPLVAEWLAMQVLDLVCVACFPWRIPATLLALPTYGFMNVHPSLLPAYRGPAPLFWQLRAGLSSGGVTVHWMDATFDTGPIAGQATLLFPNGATSTELDRLFAQTGATLLLEVIGQLSAGHRPQQPQTADDSQQSWPTAADFRLDRQWSARHAYTFMRGVDEWRHPYPITIEDEELLLRRALHYTPDQQLGQPLVRNGAEVAIQFSPGVVTALLW